MSSAAARAVDTAACVTNADALPDVFARVVWLVAEIDEAAMNTVAQIVKLRAARVEKNATDMRAALGELRKLTSQQANMLDTLDRVLP
jgi:hypothetical protein